MFVYFYFVIISWFVSFGRFASETMYLLVCIPNKVLDIKKHCGGFPRVLVLFILARFIAPANLFKPAAWLNS